MTHRTERVWLANDIARCEPSHKISNCQTCGRYLAAVPPMGSMADFSLSISMFAPYCANYLSSKQEPTGEVTKEAKPWPVSNG